MCVTMHAYRLLTVLFMYQDEFTGMLFVDFAEAIDVIDQCLLLQKLEMFGLSPYFPFYITVPV